MTKKKSCDTYEMLKEKLTYIPSDDLDLIYKAYEYANDYHFGQKRLTGENYISHPLSVAYILTTIKADSSTIASALLHECYKTEEDIKEIEKKFGSDITSVVSGITKINNLNYSLDSKSVSTHQQKIIVGLSEDVRVIIIKLADQLHNMRTLFVLDEEKQKEMARETLDILTPIAHRLGINSIKTELEELSLRYLKPDDYYDIVEKLNTTKVQRDQNVLKMIEIVSDLLNKHNISHSIKGRSKSIYSIYKKLQKGKRFSEIYDLLALRILTQTEEECYQALGIIHSKFKPKPKRFKDYIASPKTNMYQSLHTTVFGEAGQLYEIQIRTYKMDEVAENGIASHWSYKEKGSNSKSIQSDMEQKLQFFKSIMELKKVEDDPNEFAKSVQEDVLQNTIYVFTPKGDVIELPKGATPIDFAYKVHTNIGNTITGALVNSSIVPLNYELENQDVVKINTSSNSMPKRDWLDIVKTSQAKNKIRSFFNKIDKDENIKKGEELLNKHLKKEKISFDTFNEKLQNTLNNLKFGSLNEIYSNIGSNKITPESVIEAAFKDERKKDKILSAIVKKDRKVSNNNIVSVSGFDDIKVNLAGCCTPVYKDRIVGYITKGNGITVHRMVCPNISNISERLIEVNWNETNEKFISTIVIKIAKEADELVNIVTLANNSKTEIKNIVNSKNSDGQVIELTVIVSSKDELIKFMDLIKSIKNVKEVERLIR